MVWKHLYWLTAVPLLVGCSAVKNPEALADSIREGYAAANEIHAEAVIRASTGENIQEYRVQVQYENTEQPRAEVTVKEPQSIAGITAVYDAEANSLMYDDMILQTVLPEQSGLTPVDVVPATLHCVMMEEPAMIWQEGDCLMLQYEEEEDAGTVMRELALQAQDGSLQSVEIFLNGTQRLSCSFDSCTIYQ